MVWAVLPSAAACLMASRCFYAAAAWIIVNVLETKEETALCGAAWQNRTIRYKNNIVSKEKWGGAMGTIMGITAEKLKEMAAVDVRTVDISTLADLRDIEIDTKAPVSRKLESFAAQTGNLYVNRIGDYVVKVRYQESGPTINDKMEEYIRRLSEFYI